METRETARFAVGVLAVALFLAACRTPPPPAPIDLAMVAQQNELAPIRQEATDPNAVDAEGNAPLHVASANQAYDAALLLLSVGADVSLANQEGRTALHVAAATDAADITRLLLLHGANVDARDDAGDTPLAVAVSAESREAAAVLAESGADLVAMNQAGRTPVHLADEETRDAILTPNTVNRPTDTGNTPLVEAVRKNLPTVVDALVDRGADFTTPSADGDRPLEIALDAVSRAGESEAAADVAAVLITAGAQPQTAEFSYLVDPLRGRNVNLRTVTGETALMVAVERDHTGFIDYLIDAGAQLDLTGPGGATALHGAVRNGNADVAAELLAAGANPNVRDLENHTPLHLAPGAQADRFARMFTTSRTPFDLSIQDRDGNTVLMSAVQEQWQLDAVRTLVVAGADVSATNNAGDTPLHEAVRSGQFTIADYLLSAGASAFARNTAGKTPFHLALEQSTVQATDDTGRDALALFLADEGLSQTDENGNSGLHIAVRAATPAATIERIAEAGASVDARNNRGNTPLHLAMEQEAREIVRLFLDEGADLFFPNAEGRTPLGVAARLDPTFFKWLVDQGVIGRTDARGNGPLHVVASEGLLDAAIVLLNRDAPADRENSLRETPLHAAAAANHADVVQLLLEYGADPNARNQLGDTPLHLAAAAEASDAFAVLLAGGASINVRNANGRTPLFQAVIANRPDAVELLLDQGASPTIQDNQGRTCLHIAAERGLREIIDVLLSGGIEIPARDNTGNTALHFAIRNRNLDSAERLLAAGANIFARNRNGESPLTIALAIGGRTLRRILSGGRVNGVDDDGNTPLHVAISRGYGEQTATLLVELGADPNARNQDGRTPLHLAVEREAEAVGRYLILAGADIHVRDTAGESPAILALRDGPETVAWFFSDPVVNAADNQGNTALHLAAAEGLAGAVEPLLSAGADPRLRNLAGQLPADVARQNGHRDVAALLE